MIPTHEEQLEAMWWALSARGSKAFHSPGQRDVQHSTLKAKAANDYCIMIAANMEAVYLRANTLEELTAAIIAHRVSLRMHSELRGDSL